MDSRWLSFTIAAGITMAANTPVHADGNEKAHGDWPVTHGVAVGDVSDHGAVIWSRTDREGDMHASFMGQGHTRERSVHVNADDDFTGKIAVDGLRPDAVYQYKVWFGDDLGGDRKNAATGVFRTAPEARDAKAVTFVWGGDVGGQNVCRDAQQGMPIFDVIDQSGADFFVGLGDMIYADGTCDTTGLYGNTQVPGTFGPAASMADYWAHWKYNREDQTFRDVLAKMPYYAIWDDHEVANDFGPLHDTRDYAPYTPGAHLLPLGRKAFLDYNPVSEDSATPKRLYRNIRWGKNVELFILDTRQYRDANQAADDASRPKTMLGREQLVWLKDKLAASDATWKVIVSSVPMSIPTGGNGRDGWGNYTSNQGFENELLDILRFMQQHGIYNNVWITTDVHFAEVFRYTPFGDDPAFQVHEFVTGPLNAGLFPNHAFDDTLNTESLFFYGPDGAVANYEEAKTWMNFGAISVDENGDLNASIKDVSGHRVYEMSLMPH